MSAGFTDDLQSTTGDDLIVRFSPGQDEIVVLPAVGDRHQIVVTSATPDTPLGEVLGNWSPEGWKAIADAGSFSGESSLSDRALLVLWHVARQIMDVGESATYPISIDALKRGTLITSGQLAQTVTSLVDKGLIGEHFLSATDKRYLPTVRGIVTLGDLLPTVENARARGDAPITL